jgi:hypothetical protein
MRHVSTFMPTTGDAFSLVGEKQSDGCFGSHSAFKPFHHDSHAYAAGGAGQSDVKEDFTVGVSLGAERELVFKHVASGQQFSFPQKNGDLFAFDSSVNKQFQHGVPHARERSVGPRFSLIAWGRRRTLNARNAGVNEIGTREAPKTPLRVPGVVASADATAAHGAPTNEETTTNNDDKTNEVVCSIEEVAHNVQAFVEQQTQKRAEAEAAKQASKEKAAARSKAKPRVQGGWNKKASK